MAEEIRALTGVRGVAAAVIVVYHFGDVQLATGGTGSFFRIPYGYLLVDMFFMLSGYVMALNYRETFQHLTGKVFANFMLKRIARLYPAYFVIGLFYVAKIAAGLSGEKLEMYSGWDWFGNLFMLSGWGLYIFPIIGVAWAASAEMGSYLLLPLLMPWTQSRQRWIALLAVVAALVGIYAVSITGRGSGGPLDVVNGNSLYPMLRAVCGFALGLAIFRFGDIVDRLSATMQDILVIAIPLAIIAVGIADASDRLMYLLYIPLVAVLSRDGRMAQLLFGNRLVYRLGIISYSIYLIHPLFVSFTIRSWRHFGQTDGNYIVFSLIAFATIWALAEVSYRLVEMPGRRALMRLFAPRRPVAPVA